MASSSLDLLSNGPLHPFSLWPNSQVPSVAAGVYTVWRGADFIYAGMSGRSLTADNITESRQSGSRRTGLYTRLNSHWSGRRSGDQFCIYVCDRLVLPQLSDEEVRAVGEGAFSLDAATRDFIRTSLGYRYVETDDGRTALALEAEIRRGGLPEGKPFLNPLA